MCVKKGLACVRVLFLSKTLVDKHTTSKQFLIHFFPPNNDVCVCVCVQSVQRSLHGISERKLGVDPFPLSKQQKSRSVPPKSRVSHHFPSFSPRKSQVKFTNTLTHTKSRDPVTGQKKSYINQYELKHKLGSCFCPTQPNARGLFCVCY